MEKHINPFAIAIAVVGVVYFVLRLFEIFLPSHAWDGALAMQHSELGRALMNAMARQANTARVVGGFAAALMGAAELIGIAALIELVDRIRWDIRNKTS